MPASKAQQAVTAKRRAQALAMRLAGANLDQIADALGYAGRAAACKDIQRALAVARAEAAAGAADLRQVEALRLDRLQAGLWARALAGDSRAADTVLRIIDRRIRLYGLDAPLKVLTYDAVEAEMERLSGLLGIHDLPGQTVDPAEAAA